VELLEAVVAGRYGPGEKLPRQRALAADLGVTLQPLRESLKSLEQVGVVEARHGDATRVRDWHARHPRRPRPPMAGGAGRPAGGALAHAARDRRPGGGAPRRAAQVHGARGLYVGDGSVVPSSPHVNPHVTIMALAVRLGRALAGTRDGALARMTG
jgi:DNA-binding transcriptional MocR family regulator